MTAVFYTNSADVVVVGNSADNTFYGLDGNDFLQFNFTVKKSTTVEGGNGNDSILSSLGNDFVYGGNGDDLLTLMGGKDQGYGGDGKDTLNGDYERTPDFTVGEDVLYGGEGKDKINGGGRADVLSGDGGDDQLYGDRKSNGGKSKKPGDDRIYGGEGRDTLQGQSGSDTLDGGLGDDKLTGGSGGDLLTGGAGADRFIYLSAGESSVSNPDTIDDFHSAKGDKIDLAGIDAKASSSSDQAFTFIGSNAFTVGVEGELRFDAGVLSGDTTGDGVADFSIKVNNVATLVDSDFIL